MRKTDWITWAEMLILWPLLWGVVAYVFLGMAVGIAAAVASVMSMLTDWTFRIVRACRTAKG